MSNNRIKRTEKKPLPEGTQNKVEVVIGNTERLKVQLLAQIDQKLGKLIELTEKKRG